MSLPRRRLLELGALLVVGAGGGAAALLAGGSSQKSPPPRVAATRPLARPESATVERTRERRRAAALRGDEPPAERELALLASIGLPLYCGGDRGRDLALTFDDGPGRYTSLALRILRRDGAHATFFLVGRNLARFARHLPRAERALGAVGDHTWNHRDLPVLPPRLMREEIAQTQRAVAAASGAPVRLFRPPYGAHDAAVDRDVRSLGMLEVLWSIDTSDSEGAPWYRIAATAERLARPGAIVLMHENRGQTIRALRFRLLPWLHRHDYRLVSIPQLLALDPPTIAQLRAGYRGCFSRTKRA